MAVSRCVQQVVERTLKDLCTKYNTVADSPRVGVVRLTGLVHNADRVAFREIARQLCMCAVNHASEAFAICAVLCIAFFFSAGSRRLGSSQCASLKTPAKQRSVP
jgi:hypothetical protein